MAKAQKPGSKCKKAGRCLDSPAHKRYTAERRWIKHKVNRVVRYIRKHPNWKLPVDMSDEVRTRIQVILK